MSTSGGIQKNADDAQVSALEKLLNSGFEEALSQRLSNIGKTYRQGDRILLSGYDERAANLSELRRDAERSEAGSSFANVGNRARETNDVLAEAASQGAGETDLLNAQLMAVRNWAANQGEVNRAFYDSISSNNAATVDLNADTKSARFNLAQQMLSDKEQATATYANQMADAATQLGNIQGNPYSSAYNADGGEDAWDQMVSAATRVFNNRGVSSKVTDWEGWQQPEQEKQNNTGYLVDVRSVPAIGDQTAPARLKGTTADGDTSDLWRSGKAGETDNGVLAPAVRGVPMAKRPEGATLKAW